MPISFKLDQKTVLSIARLVLIGVALIGLALMFDVPQSTDSYDQYAQQVDSLRRAGRRQLVIADSLKRVIEQRNTKIQQSDRRVAALNRELTFLRGHTQGLTDEVDSLKETLTDSVAMAREIIPRQERIIVQKDEEIEKQGLIITEHLYTITLRDSTILNITTSRDSLADIVRRMQPAPPNPNKLFGIFPMPSRTTVFVVGTATGAAAATAIMLSR